jgi:energy-coupling factor transporter ATP-binding protein EcfA2
MLLMRSRGEAELARMMTEIEKLDNLRTLWENSSKPSHLRCLLDDGHIISSTGRKHNKLVLRNLHYSRGTAMARADHIELGSGVYALTGANGSGKSTLFRILMSCNTNDKSIELPSSINLLTPAKSLTEEDDLRGQTACLAALDDDDSLLDESCDVDVNISTRELHPRSSITMPSKHVVEISQNFYWPLYSEPIDWILQDQSFKNYKSDRQKQVRRVAEALHELQFFQSGQDTNEDNVSSNGVSSENVTIAMDGRIDALTDVTDSSVSELTIQRIMMELQQEKEDWFNDLSGGQKSKVELVRTVFLREKCPDVLLVDETMAPLDPSSKQLVMAKLKNFCEESIIIVIYHTDVGQGKEVEGMRVDCVPSNEFFNKNIHLEKGIVHVRDTC